MGDHQVRVGQRFELPHHPGMIATLQEELSDERWRVHWTLDGGEACCTSVSIQSWIATRGWVPIEAYEAPKLEPVSIETCTGRELDVLAEARYGLRRNPAHGTWAAEPDLSLRTRCMMAGTLVLPEHVCGPGCATCDPPAKVPEVAAGDTWVTPEKRRLFVHSPIADSVYWNVAIDNAQITTSMLATDIHRLGKSTLFHRTAWDHVQPAVEPTACPTCREVPPKGHADHVCPKHVSRFMSEPSIRLWIAAREAETGTRFACCGIGGVKKYFGVPCPMHPPAREPFVAGYDSFDFLKP